MDKIELITFSNDDFSLEVKLDSIQETVWLSQTEMAKLFNVTIDSISLHIKNIINDGELDISTIEDFSVVQKEGNRNVKRTIKIYNLDMILSVGYRVNSKRGIQFRKWTSSILKEYMINGYAINKKRMNYLEKTIEIQTKMLSSSLDVDIIDLKDVINNYTNALTLLDDYDHQVISKPKGNKSINILTYDDCIKIINTMKYKHDSKVFGLEKESGVLDGILKQINQVVFDVELYPSIEEKAAKLLYFIVKDHPFVDGCKRIGAAIFLEFLNRNKRLFINNKQVLSNSTLVALTLLVAESKYDEMDIIINVVMNCLEIC